jgi:hypothetical protein
MEAAGITVAEGIPFDPEVIKAQGFGPEPDSLNSAVSSLVEEHGADKVGVLLISFEEGTDLLDGGWPYPFGSASATEDSPGWSNLGDGHQEYTSDDDFVMYVMYQPDGTNAAWVPLRKVSWGWNGGASRDGTTWSLDSGDHYTNADADCTTHPEWDGRLQDLDEEKEQ